MQTQRVLGVLFLSLLCSACGMNLRPVPAANTMSLAGTWQAPATQRQKAIEQLQTAMKQADEKQAKRERKRGGFGGPPPAEGGAPQRAPTDAGAAAASPPRENWEMREHREEQQGLINLTVPPETFKLTQSPGRIDIVPKTGARRSFTPGDPSTLVTTFGSFYIESGWQNDEFVVHSKDAPDGVNIVERYHKQMDGSLSVTVTLATKEIKEQTFKLVYASQP